MAETLRPTAHTVQEGAVDNPGNAYDGNANTLATLRAPTPGDRAIEDVHGFSNGSISPTMRESVILRVPARHESADGNDRAFIGISIDGGANFQLVNATMPPSGWPLVPAAAAYRDFDVTDIVGTTPYSQVHIRYQMSNGSPPPATPPVFQV